MAAEGLLCPECGREGHLIKSGWKWSGRHKVQRYQCLTCGRATTAPVLASKLGRPKMVMLKKVWLNLKWVFGYRAVLMREPSARALVVYAKMGRAVATKHCAVCGDEYWVVGNPKVRGHFSPVCGSRKCYVGYHLHPERYQPVRVTRRQPSDKVRLVKPNIANSKRRLAKFSGNQDSVSREKALTAGYGGRYAEE